MADDLLTFEPLFAEEDEEAILARWREWANEGRDPSEAGSAEWTDTREGSHWWVQTTPGRREAARLYERAGTEVIAAAFPQYAWGEFLDDHAELRGLERLASTPAEGEVRFSGTNGTVIPVGTVVAVEPASEDDDAPEFEVTEEGLIALGEATVAVVARADSYGTVGNVAANAITTLISSIPEVTAVTNLSAMLGGTDTETDEALRVRVLESYSAPAVANQAYYRRLLLNEEGVGRVTVIPVADGPGTLDIIVTTAEGEAIGAPRLAELQALVDPTPEGTGAGEGQVGATITVRTATELALTLEGTIEPEPGYSLEGSANTVTLRETIEEAVAAYTDELQSGEEVVYARVIAEVMNVTGVHDSDLTINGGTANVAIPTDPARVIVLTRPTDLVEGVL
jgi:uncharacterized phage protein gp47/JayE